MVGGFGACCKVATRRVAFGLGRFYGAATRDRLFGRVGGLLWLPALYLVPPHITLIKCEALCNTETHWIGVMCRELI